MTLATLQPDHGDQESEMNEALQSHHGDRDSCESKPLQPEHGDQKSSNSGNLRESTDDDAETVYLEVGTDCDTSDEENAEFTH